MFIIQIGSKTFYRYGGNTRNKELATRFMENEMMAAVNICDQFRNAKVIRLV